MNMFFWQLLPGGTCLNKGDLNCDEWSYVGIERNSSGTINRAQLNRNVCSLSNSSSEFHIFIHVCLSLSFRPTSPVLAQEYSGMLLLLASKEGKYNDSYMALMVMVNDPIEKCTHTQHYKTRKYRREEGRKE
jgi:hypothetical protein